MTRDPVEQAADLRRDADRQDDRREREWRLDAAAEVEGHSLAGSAAPRPSPPDHDRKGSV